MRKEITVRRFLGTAFRPGFAPQGDFLSWAESHQRPTKGGAFPLLVESTLLVRGETASFCFRPLVWRGHIDGMVVLWAALAPMEMRPSIYQGLTLVKQLFPAAGAWLTAAGTPLLQGRPGRGNCLVVGPVARITWGGSSPRSHSKSDGPRINLTQFQPGTPGRSLGGNALSDSFPDFLSLRNRAQRSVPTRLASRCRSWQKIKAYAPLHPGEEATSSPGLFCCAPPP